MKSSTNVFTVVCISLRSQVGFDLLNNFSVDFGDSVIPKCDLSLMCLWNFFMSQLKSISLQKFGMGIKFKF